MIFKAEKILIHFGQQKFKINSGAAFITSVILAIAIGSAGTSIGEPSCCTVGGYNGWSAADKLNEIGSSNVESNNANILQVSGANEPKKVESFANGASISAKSSKLFTTPTNQSEILNQDVILDVDAEQQGSIRDAVHIDYRKFLDSSNRPKSIFELSEILGDAGISRNDSVALLSKDPFAAAYVYLILDYLGQEQLKLLNNNIEGEVLAGESIDRDTTLRPKANYIPSPKTDIIASYDYVKRKDVQVVDSRPYREYSIGSVLGSKNIPYDMVLDGKKIKDKASLRNVFSNLSTDKPVVVYSNDGIKASLLWYALKLEGYNPRLYAGDNWAANLLIDGGEGKSQSESALGTPVNSDNSVAPSSFSGPKPKCH